MKELQLFIAAGLLGYLIQCGAGILIILTVAKKQIEWRSYAIASLAFTVALYFVRTFGKFNFGIHTMLTLIIVNILCIIMLKIDVRASVLGSFLMTALILAMELFNFMILMLLYEEAEITLRMAEPLFKAWAAVPGNILLVVIVVATYVLRVAKAKRAA